MEADLSRVLVVDDEESIRSLLVSALRSGPFHVETAATAEEALARYEGGDRFDLVLTDLRMPGMGGEELAARLGREYPATAVVVMTGYPSIETARQAIRSRACDYIEKPFDDLPALRGRMEEILAERRRRMEKTTLVRELADRNRELENQRTLLTRKVDVTQRNLREQMKSLQRSREVFYSDLARVMAILDNLMDGIVFTDPAGKVILMNPAAGTMLDVPPFTAIGRSLQRVGGNRPLLSLLAAHRAMVLDEEGAQAEISMNSGRADEAYAVHSTPIPDFKGALSGVLSLIRDVSLRKKTEHLKNQFLSIVAHELRTPLTTIKAFATILDKGIYGVMPEEQKGLILNILSQSDRLGHEIDKIISLGRLEASDFAPDLSEVSAEQILAKIPVPFRGEAKEKGIDFTVSDESDGATLVADGRDIQRAIRALVENALKFTPDGGRVTVRSLAEEDYVVFEVEDTGIGIAPQDQKVIFEKFIQLENPLTRKHGGSGLGLSFASEILKSHGSRIEVESDLGKGATFRFRLPRARRRAGAGPAAVSVRTDSKATTQRR